MSGDKPLLYVLYVRVACRRQTLTRSLLLCKSTRKCVVDRRYANASTLQPGDIYRLLPPEEDIHTVKTTSKSPSVSIHVLGNDTGCIWWHQFIPEAHSVKSFRSGYSKAPCKEEEKENVRI